MALDKNNISVVQMTLPPHTLWEELLPFSLQKRANYVHHFARRLYDAGGLYTLSNQPSSVMRNNRIEHLIDAPYATNDRAFYIYFDEATDGYTVENNWCPSERFDSNRPGPHNVWKKNGPQVDESIKQKAGRVAVGGVSQPRIIIKTK